LIGFTHAAIVEDDHAKTLGQRRDLKLEAVAATRQAVDQQQRLAFAVDFVVEVDVVDFDLRHLGRNIRSCKSSI